VTNAFARVENPWSGSSKGYPAWSRGRGNRKRAHVSENDRDGLILNPGDWRVLDETRRVLATPDGTDALSDVKLKHAALTRRFDDTPYNLASRPLPSPLIAPLGTTGFLPSSPADSPGAVPRPRQARDRDSGCRGYSVQYDERIAFFETRPKTAWHIFVRYR